MADHTIGEERPGFVAVWPRGQGDGGMASGCVDLALSLEGTLLAYVGGPHIQTCLCSPPLCSDSDIAKSCELLWTMMLKVLFLALGGLSSC